MWQLVQRATSSPKLSSNLNVTRILRLLCGLGLILARPIHTPNQFQLFVPRIHLAKPPQDLCNHVEDLIRLLVSHVMTIRNEPRPVQVHGLFLSLAAHQSSPCYQSIRTPLTIEVGHQASSEYFGDGLGLGAIGPGQQGQEQAQ